MEVILHSGNGLTLKAIRTFEISTLTEYLEREYEMYGNGIGLFAKFKLEE